MLGPPKPRRLDQPPRIVPSRSRGLVPADHFYRHVDATEIDLAFVRDRVLARRDLAVINGVDADRGRAEHRPRRGAFRRPQAPARLPGDVRRVFDAWLVADRPSARRPPTHIFHLDGLHRYHRLQGDPGRRHWYLGSPTPPTSTRSAAGPRAADSSLLIGVRIRQRLGRLPGPSSERFFERVVRPPPAICPAEAGLVGPKQGAVLEALVPQRPIRSRPTPTSIRGRSAERGPATRSSSSPLPSRDPLGRARRGGEPVRPSLVPYGSTIDPDSVRSGTVLRSSTSVSGVDLGQGTLLRRLPPREANEAKAHVAGLFDDGAWSRLRRRTTCRTIVRLDEHAPGPASAGGRPAATAAQPTSGEPDRPRRHADADRRGTALGYHDHYVVDGGQAEPSWRCWSRRPT